MQKLLMPKATAIWLIDNTTLTFEQIAEFIDLHLLEVQAIADGEVAPDMHGIDPVRNGQLTAAEITRCEADTTARLVIAESDLPTPVVRHKGPRYTPVSKRADKPDGIAWLLRNHPELLDSQIGRLIGTTKPTITAIRERTHWNSANLTPRSPMELGLCTQQDLAIEMARAAKAGRMPPERPVEKPAEPALGGWEGLA